MVAQAQQDASPSWSKFMDVMQSSRLSLFTNALTHCFVLFYLCWPPTPSFESTPPSTMEPAARNTSSSSNKDLLHLESKIQPTSSSLLESTLVLCNRDSSLQTQNSNNKLVTTPVPISQLLDKAKDFLAIMEDANRRLEHEAKETSNKDYDIETLTGNEEEYIEMDLVLGVADLHTPEAVAAAQSAISGSQPVINLDPKTNGSESESSEDDDSDDNDDDSDGDFNDKACSSNKPQEPNSVNGGYTSNSQPKRQRKIIELL